MLRKLGLVIVLSFGFGTQVLAQETEAINSGAKVAKDAAAASATKDATDGPKNAAQCPAVTFKCVLAGLNYAQVPLTIYTMVSAGKTQSQASAGGGGGFQDFSDPNGFNDSAPGGIPPNFQRMIDDSKKGLDELEKKGFKFGKRGQVTGPNGKTASASSGKSLAEAGIIPEDQIEDYDKALLENKRQKNKIIVKSLGGGAKGGYKAKRRRAASTSDYGTSYNYGIDQSKIKAAETSGLTKDFGGTPIGVASDDLFNMVSQRYNTLSEQKQFIDNPSGTYTGQR